MKNKNIDLLFTNEVVKPYINSEKYKRVIKYKFVYEGTNTPIFIDRKGNFVNKKDDSVLIYPAKIKFIKEKSFIFDTSNLTDALLYSVEYKSNIHSNDFNEIRNFVKMLENYPHLISKYNLTYDTKKVEENLLSMLINQL